MQWRARGRHHHRLTHQQVRDHRSDRVEMLEVVQNQQHPPRPEPGDNVVVGLQPNRLRHRRPHRVRLPQRCQPDEEHTIRELIRQLRRRLQRQPRLPRPARPGQRHQPRVARDQVADLLQFPLTPQQRPRSHRQVRLMQRPQRRELGRQPVDLELVEPDRLEHVLQPMRPQITQRHPVEQCGGRLRNKHLATMPRSHDPGRPVHIHPHILRRHRQRLPGMHTHPHPQPTLVRPHHRRQALLRLTRSRDRLTRSLERNQEGVTLFVDLIAAMPCERLTQHPPMQRKRLREPLRTQPLQQQRRPLHIREQQRHRPRRLRHHQATSLSSSSRSWR